MPKDYQFMDDRPGGFYNDDLTKNEERKLRKEFQRQAESRGTKKNPLIARTRKDKGLLESVGENALRAGSIFITIFLLLVGAPLAAQYNNRYDNFPNANADLYVPTHEYVDSVDFTPFGEGAVDNAFGFIRNITYLVQPIYNLLLGDPGADTVGGFADTFGEERNYQIYLMLREGGTNATVYAQLTSAERTWVLTNRSSVVNSFERQTFYTSRFQLLYSDTQNLFGGGLKFFFTEPSVYDIIVQES